MIKYKKDTDISKQMWDFVPYDYAIRELKALHVQDRYVEREQGAFSELGHCKCCGFPLTERGFVRLPFPVGHRLFGKAVCCPLCWPEPFGHAARGLIGDGLVEIASAWRDILAGL